MSDVTHPSDYEKSDADPRLVGGLALGMAVFLIAVPFGLLAVYPGSDRLGGLPPDRPMPPQPRLQVHPKADLDQLRRTEDQQLNGFGWIDRNRQVVRIPIERAMDLLVQRGIPDWPPPPPPRPAPK